MHSLLITAVAALFVPVSEGSKFHSDIALHVETTVGTVEGFIDPTVPQVKQWLGIPFAEPPVGPLRWKAPVAKAKSIWPIEAKSPADSCAQFLDPRPSIFNDLTPEFLPPPSFSEDCLYLNVIAPATRGRKLPVLVWEHGGQAQWGGINTPYEKPHKWVQRTQAHIVVQMSYRLNIFGFPNAKGLNDTNFGLLDTRMALEWVRDNIENFGGDPGKITFWGQSGGASGVDAHQFAFPLDPIFHAAILQSGVILLASTDADLDEASFSYVAQQLGCSAAGGTARGEVECMRGIDADTIESFIENHTVSGAAPSLYFSARADGKLFFTPEEYVAMGTAGQFANVPNLIGTNSEEGASFVPYSPNNNISETTLQNYTKKYVQCPVSTTCRYREASGRLTYRYFYSGNFSNISPVDWIGAYHFAEIPLVMGTHSDYRSPSTDFESKLSEEVQDMWLAFANDPWNGLERHNWSAYSSNGTALVLGKDDVLVGTASVVQLDSGCSA